MKTFKRSSFYAVLMLSLALCACATSAPQTPAQTIYQAKASYGAALTIAVAYKRLPVCGLPTSPKLCSQPAIVTKLQQADDVAAPLLQAAQNTARMEGAGANAATATRAAQEAVAALTAITATLATQ